MFAEIIITSPDKEVKQLVGKIQNELNVYVSVVETFWDAVNSIKEILSREPDCIRVIASGGATLSLLYQIFPSEHFVDLYPNEYDIVIALDQAKKFGKELGLFLAAYRNLDVIEKLSAILGIQVRVYKYNDWQELENNIIQARRDGCEIIIGVGDKISNLVTQAGLQFIPMIMGEGTLRNVLEWAQKIIKAEIREKFTTEQMNAISINAHEGILMVNEENIVTVCNPVASKMLGLREVEIVGRSLLDLNSSLSLGDLIKDFEKKLGFIHQVPNGSLLVNRFPIVDQQQCPKGVLLTLMDITKIQDDGKSSRQLSSKGMVAKYYYDNIVHKSSKMSSVIAQAKIFANTDCTILIRGESGTGKELLAQSIHNGHKVRCQGPFVAVNCASFNEHLFGSELFGYTEGSFTGASKGGKLGLFEMAKGGTLFLDEIGKMKLEQQDNLLRVLQEKEVRRIGSDRVIPVDVRVIAASNEDLEELIRRGSFREDLFYRINVLNLVLPPLRERREDIPAQVIFFLHKFSGKYGKSIYNLPLSILNKLSNMDWPGNSRQLEHYLERCVVLAENERDAAGFLIEQWELESAKTNFPAKNEGRAGEDQINVRIGTLAEMNTEIVRKLRSKSKLSNSELAVMLDISRPTISKLLNKK